MAGIERRGMCLFFNYFIELKPTFLYYSCITKKNEIMDEKILQNLNRRLDDALEEGRKVVKDEQLFERINELKKQTEQTIRKHPVKSVAIGLLVGYVVGKIFSSED